MNAFDETIIYESEKIGGSKIETRFLLDARFNRKENMKGADIVTWWKWVKLMKTPDLSTFSCTCLYFTTKNKECYSSLSLCLPSSVRACRARITRPPPRGPSTMKFKTPWQDIPKWMMRFHRHSFCPICIESLKFPSSHGCPKSLIINNIQLSQKFPAANRAL